MPDALIGKNIGGFLIEERLGQGAMATVYKAFESSISRYVAMKIIKLDESQQEEFKQRFAREAEVIAKLEHIHILPIYAYGLNDELAYLAMRWLKGGSLNDMLKRGSIPLERTANIFQQVAEGLAFAHSKGIIHRDLKPSNIMMDDAGNAYLTDFGLAKLTESSGEITRSGTIVGTPAYMSPEQLRGEPLDHRSDIYSLGVILYNMVAGRLPFDTTTSDLVSIIYQHLEKPPTPPREFNPNTPVAVEEVILKALQKDRKDRFNTATEMARALNLAVGLPVGSSTHLVPAKPLDFQRALGSTTQNAQIGKAGRWTLITTVVGILVLILVIALVIIQNIVVLPRQQQAAMTAQAATPIPPQIGTVLVGQTKLAGDIVPTGDQFKAAVKNVGNQGFLAYIACTQDSEFHAGMAREIGDLAKHYGMPYKLYDSQVDPYREITLFERARAEGASAMIVCPLDINLLMPSLKSAHNANVPLVVQANNIPNTGGVLVGGDDYLLGVEPGRFAGKIIRDEMKGQADVIILDYPDRADIVLRANGLEDGLKEFAPQAKVIGRYVGASREVGKASVEKLLKDGLKFNFILSINDAGSFGAIDAMVEAGIDPKNVTIVSIDAEVLAQEYIRKGYFIRGSVESSRMQLAEAMFDAAVQLLGGNDVPEHVIVPPKQIVTKETLATQEAEMTAAPSPTP
jgi:ABC-type sugar transport system substrate-binding protein/tRNA A-37 threonylcarbamoyl transferase component Bud32